MFNRGGVARVGWVTAVLLFVCLVGWWLLPHEPSYEGRRLSEWLQDFESDSMETRAMAVEALRKIGAPAVPFLVRRLSVHVPGDERRASIRQWSRRILEWIGEHTGIKVAPVRVYNPRTQVLAGLDALGPEARSALPVLEQLVNQDPPDPDALYVVARIGEAGVSVLTKALTNAASAESNVLRHAAAVCLEMMKSHSETLYPNETEHSQYPDYFRRICRYHLLILTSAAWENLTQHPDLVAPKGWLGTNAPALP